MSFLYYQILTIINVCVLLVNILDIDNNTIHILVNTNVTYYNKYNLN